MEKTGTSVGTGFRNYIYLADTSHTK